MTSQLCKNPKPDGSWCGVPITWGEIEGGKKRPFEVDTGQIHKCQYYKPKSFTPKQQEPIKESSTGNKTLDFGIKGEIENLTSYVQGLGTAILAIRSILKTGVANTHGEDIADKIEKLSEELAETQTALHFETKKNLERGNNK